MANRKKLEYETFYHIMVRDTKEILSSFEESYFSEEKVPLPSKYLDIVLRNLILMDFSTDQLNTLKKYAEKHAKFFEKKEKKEFAESYRSLADRCNDLIADKKKR